MNEEIFPVVDEAGNIIGSASRAECHSGKKILHPVVHLHVVDRDGRILLQKRSMNKDIQPGKWDTAVGGHVDLGENIRMALMREAKEELGLDASEAIHIDSYVFESKVEKELVNTFVLRIAEEGKNEIKADPVEIDEVKFWSVNEIVESKGKGVLTPNFEMEFEKIFPRIKEML